MVAHRRWTKSARVVAGYLLLLLAGSAALGTFAREPAQKEAELKTVHGTVVDAAENPIPSAVVYLKNLKTLAVKTYISEDDGRYRFSGLDPNVDYQIHAEHGDQASQTHTISALDSRKEFVIALKVNKKRSNK